MERHVVNRQTNIMSRSPRRRPELHKILSDLAQVIHSLRLNAVLDSVQALLAGQRLVLTALGRHLPGDTTPEHAIKRMDGLLGNPHFQQKRPLFYWHVARLFIGRMRHTRFLVDWSPVDDRGRYHVLRAANRNSVDDRHVGQPSDTSVRAEGTT